MQEEIWKDIEGYEGFYQVSNLGRVKSVARYVQRKSTPQFVCESILSQHVINTGYYVVSLWRLKSHKLFLVHRLVAEAFLSKVENKNFVDHINGIRTDNRLENLRWCSRIENTNFPLARAKYNASNKNRIKHIIETKATKLKKVVQLKPDGTFVKVWDSAKEASKYTPALLSNIYSVLVNIKKTAGGYRWVYLSEYNNE